jgi:hypothetical protein
MNKSYPVNLIIAVLCLIIVFVVTGFRQISAETQDGQNGLHLWSAAPKSDPIAQAQSRPAVAIVSPAPNQQFGLGQPITVVATVSDPQGIVRVELVAGNQVVVTQVNPQPQPNQTVSLTWQPNTPGDRSLQVLAYNSAGVVGSSTVLPVTVIPATPEPLPPTTIPTPTPTAFPYPVQTPFPSVHVTPAFAYPYLQITAVDSLAVQRGPSTRYDQIGVLLRRQSAGIVGRADVGAGNWWQIDYPPGPSGPGWVPDNPDFVAAFNTEQVPAVVPPPTPIAPPASTPVLVPGGQPVQIDFRADRTSIRKGECVTFFWNVTGVREVWFDGDGVPGENQSRQECPDKSKTYALRVKKVDQTVDTRYINIEVRESGTGYETVQVRRDTGIDFDNGARDTGGGNDFLWYLDGDRPIFEKWNNDSNLRLVRVADGGSDELDELSKDICRWYLDRYDQRSVAVSKRTILCFVTNEGKVGKLRVKDGDRDSLTIEWHRW